MKAAFKLIDKLLSESHRPMNVMALDKVLTFGIPFNAPHGFKIQSIDEHEIVIKLPNRKLNHNHLGGIHACAIATLGEFCGGLGLLKSFGISKYRLIMSELRAEYKYQGRKALTGRSQIQFDKEKIQNDIDTTGKSTQTVSTTIYDSDSQVVAIVTTTWQIKKWNLVKTKNQ